MFYSISGDCVKCGACFDECPHGAIYEGEDAYIIDPEKCTGCGTCGGLFCPVWAIHTDDEVIQ